MTIARRTAAWLRADDQPCAPACKRGRGWRDLANDAGARAAPCARDHVDDLSDIRDHIRQERALGSPGFQPMVERRYTARW